MTGLYIKARKQNLEEDINVLFRDVSVLKQNFKNLKERFKKLELQFPLISTLTKSSPSFSTTSSVQHDGSKEKPENSNDYNYRQPNTATSRRYDAETTFPYEYPPIDEVGLITAQGQIKW